MALYERWFLTGMKDKYCTNERGIVHLVRYCTLLQQHTKRYEEMRRYLRRGLYVVRCVGGNLRKRKITCMQYVCSVLCSVVHQAGRSHLVHTHSAQAVPRPHPASNARFALPQIALLCPSSSGVGRARTHDDK